MPKFVVIIGPQAVGKMTVGQELSKLTGYKLLYNHMTIDLLLNIFDYGSVHFRKLNKLFRMQIFEEFAKCDEKGIIFTGCFDFGMDFNAEKEETDEWISLFEESYVVELEASLEERLKRNKTANRLEHKASKRDLEWSERNLLESINRHKLNSEPGEGERIFKNYMKINNEKLSAEEVARMIVGNFNL